MTTVSIGRVDVSDGVLVIIDPGLGNFWKHDAVPPPPRSDPLFDIQLTGRDAETAGHAWDRSFDPLTVHDVSKPDLVLQQFEQFARKHGFEASAHVLSAQEPHTKRLKRALELGQGLGCVTYANNWCVAVGGFPTDQVLEVLGHELTEPEFAGRYGRIEVRVPKAAPVARIDKVLGVVVEHGQLMFTGLRALGEFKMFESLDGLGDFVFRGPDAEALAKELGAARIHDGLWGWLDRPMAEVRKLATTTQDEVERRALRVGVDYRPHCNLGRLNAAMRSSEEDVAELAIAGARVAACGNRWGDGVFEVLRSLDTDGRVVKVEVVLGDDKRKALMRRLMLRSKTAIITKPVAQGQPIQFAERMEPGRDDSSGWFFSAGTETKRQMNSPAFFEIVPLGKLFEKTPELEEICGAPVGTMFRRDGKRFIPD